MPRRFGGAGGPARRDDPKIVPTDITPKSRVGHPLLFCAKELLAGASRSCFSPAQLTAALLGLHNRWRPPLNKFVLREDKYLILDHSITRVSLIGSLHASNHFQLQTRLNCGRLQFVGAK
jgi:hypothetical protein